MICHIHLGMGFYVLFLSYHCSTISIPFAFLPDLHDSTLKKSPIFHHACCHLKALKLLFKEFHIQNVFIFMIKDLRYGLIPWTIPGIKSSPKQLEFERLYWTHQFIYSLVSKYLQRGLTYGLRVHPK